MASHSGRRVHRQTNVTDTRPNAVRWSPCVWSEVQNKNLHPTIASFFFFNFPYAARKVPSNVSSIARTLTRVRLEELQCLPHYPLVLPPPRPSFCFRNPPTVAGAERLLRAPCGERSVGEEKPLPIREANVGRVRRHSASVHAKRFNMAASYILPISLSVDNLGLLID